jgi:hypothetical protein
MMEIQKGLYAEEIKYSSGRVAHRLYSLEGYCFYIISANENEDGEVLSEYERVYTRFASTAYQTIEQINKDVVSVPIKDGYEIANSGKA